MPPKGRIHGKAQKPKEMKKTILRTLRYLDAYRLRFIIVLICIAISSLTTVVGALFLKILIDDYIKPILLMSQPYYGGLLRAIGIMAGIYLLGIVSSLIYNQLMVVIGQGVLKRVRDEMFAKMQSLPIRYFDQNTNGDIMSRYTNDTDTLRQMISQSVPQMFSSALTIVAVFLAMLYTSWQLTILMIVSVVVMVYIIKIIGGQSAKYFVGQQKALGEVNGFVEEIINGQKVVKVFCYEKRAKEQFDIRNENLYQNMCKANTFANIMMPVIGNLSHLQYVLIAIIGGSMAIRGVGGLSLGEIAAFLELSRSFFRPISQVSQQVNSIVMALAGAERIFALMDEEAEADNGTVRLVSVRKENGAWVQTEDKNGQPAWYDEAAVSAQYTLLAGDVRLSEVDFGYEADKLVLHDVSLYAQPGQKVAFVGATGAGKTTITNLINRFYDIADGKIRYDGININRIKKADLRRSMGIVLQDTNLFTGTVMENIRYGKLEATDEEVYAAAKLAHADSFIELLPQGYDTVLTANGGNLSQGQRQLLAIARAAVADPPVMILDEATSSIDTRTEAIVQKGMDSLMQGRTVFVIAHRLSTVQNADVIMVLEQGRIIERGNHEKLMAEKGRYYQLYTGNLK